MNFHNIKRNIKNLPYNIKNIFQWSKVLWNNFDWDSTFLLEIIQYKLERMNKYFSNANISTEETYREITDSIQICLDASRHLTSSDFEIELIDNYYDKFPFCLDKESVDEEERDKEQKAFLEMENNIIENEKKFSARLFDGIRDNYKKWWD